MPSNKDLIRMHLEGHINAGYADHWSALLAYCLGYYGAVTLDHIMVVMELQAEGKIK